MSIDIEISKLLKDIREEIINRGN